MEKMLFSGVQSNSEVALIAIKGIKNQPGIAAKVFGAIAEEKIISIKKQKFVKIFFQKMVAAIVIAFFIK